MKCLVPGPNVKIFGRALHCLAKVGEELYLDAQQDGLALRTTNSSRSAFASFLFRTHFFAEYDSGTGGTTEENKEESEPAGKRRRSDTNGSAPADCYDLGPSQSAKCKITMKSANWVFRSIAQLEKTVDCVSMAIDPDALRVVFTLHCKHAVRKAYTVPFLECESLKAHYSNDDFPNAFTAHARVLTDCALQFLQNQEEVTMKMEGGKFTMKNYIEDGIETPADKVAHTEYTMEPDQFDEYRVRSSNDEASSSQELASELGGLTFCLKELRAIISFADAFALPVSAGFEEGGKPIVFTTTCPHTFDAALVMATLADADQENNNGDANRSSQDESAIMQRQSEKIAPDDSRSVKRRRRSEEEEEAERRRSKHHSTQANSRLSASNFLSPGLTPIREQRSPPRAMREQDEVGPNGDVIDNTPPREDPRRRFFKRCFDKTFVPSKMPGSEKVYAPDSDEET